jgi:hypothetical protein
MTALLPDSARPARLARLLTSELLAESAEVETQWKNAIRSLNQGSLEEQVALLQAFAELAGSYLRAVETAKELWAEVGRLGGSAAESDQLAAAEKVYSRIQWHSCRAVDHRLKPWVPKDPERLERSLQAVREGKVVGPEEARRWFRSNPD